MSWDHIHGHENVLERFRTSFVNNRLANTYLFVGSEGIGKRMFAMELAKALFCQNSSTEFQSCGSCPSCIQVSNESHPDLILISKPPDKNFLPVELFVGDREHRRQTGLCHDINLTPFSGDRKFAIIDDADFFNAESANSLLKMLEEPPNNSILILIGTSEHRQLPTILSRCQVVRFESLSNDQVSSILKNCIEEPVVPIDDLALSSGGSVSRARELNNEELYNFRKDLFARLSTLDPAGGGFAKQICDYVESVSKESAVKRRQLILIGDFAIQLFREGIQRINELEFDVASDEESLRQLVQNQAAEEFSLVLSELIERTTMFQRHVETNMAMANIVPAWLNDLGAIARQEKLVSV